MYKSAARIACRPAVALEFGPGIPLRRGSASGDFAGLSRATSGSANSAVDSLSSPCKPWRAGGTKYAFCPQQLQRLKDYALASRQEYKWLVVDPTTAAARTRRRHEVRRELRRELRREGGQEHVDVRRRVRVQGRLQERQDGGQVHVHRWGARTRATRRTSGARGRQPSK